MKYASRRILIIDDDPVFRGCLDKVLGGKDISTSAVDCLEAQWELDFATRGQEGFEKVQRAVEQHSPYVMAFVDIHMPGWDGIETVSRIREIDCDIQVVICTALESLSEEIAQRLKSVPRAVVLKKPLDRVEVIHLVNAFAEKWEMLQQLRDQADQEVRLHTSALEAAVNGIVITDRQGRIAWVNRAFSELTGYSAEEVTGKTSAVLKSGLHDRQFYANLWQTINAGKPWHGEMVNRRKDGSTYCEEMTITPVLNAEGQIQNFIAIKKDISERKKIETALSVERDLLQSLMDNLPDYIYFKDTQSRYIRINRSQARLLGLKDPSEAIGKTNMDFLPPRLARQTLVDEQRILVEGEPMLDVPEQIQTASDQNIWVSSTKVPLRNKDGTICGLVGVSRDITERKRVEMQLSEASSLLKTLLDNVPECIYFKDLESRFVHVSQSFMPHFKVADVSCLIGKSDFDFYSDEHARPAYEDEQRIIRTGEPMIGQLEKETHPDGRVTWCVTTKMPWRDRDGKIIGTFGISKDVTAMKVAEDQRQVMAGQLQQAQKLEAIGQLAAGIAHEINTPTQYVGDNTRFLKDSFVSIEKALSAYAELLEAAKKSAVAPELIKHVDEVIAGSDLQYLFEQIPAAIKETLEGVDRVSKIVRAMKEFSHPGGKERTAADLNKAIESTVTVARNEWKYVSEMKLELDSSLPLVPCFVGEFNQCILNLVVNAAHAIGDVVKANPGTKGLITIRSRRDGDCAEIRVTDTGGGIPETVRPHIFEPFFTTKGVGKGTGQGLSIVYGSIVKKHGGTVRFETEVGRGTSFILRLPLTARAESSAGKAEKLPAITPAESVGTLRP